MVKGLWLRLVDISQIVKNILEFSSNSEMDCGSLDL